MKASGTKIEDYERLKLGYLPVLTFQVSQVPFELGNPSQAVRVELLRASPSRRLTIQFSNVVELEIDRLHPGSNCLLQIASLAEAQLEGIRYRVFNGEQDLTLSFNCWDFSFAESEL